MTQCDIIPSADNKARCPVCGRVLPGRFPVGCVIIGWELICSHCKSALKITIRRGNAVR